MLRSTSYVVVAVALAAASGSLIAQSRAVPRQFDHVRPLGRALSEFKNDRIHMVTSYSYSQISHDSRWLLIEFGALARTKMAIERFRIELVTPDGRLIPHATTARVREADDLGQLLLQSAPARSRLYWYLPYDGLCCPQNFRFGPGGVRAYAEDDSMKMDTKGPVWADLLFESPTGSWQNGTYAVVIPYDGEEAVLPIELM